MFLSNKKFEITVSSDPCYKIGSADNLFYDYILNPLCLIDEMISVFSLKINNYEDEKKIAIIGPFPSQIEGSAILKDDIMILLMNTVVMKIDLNKMTVLNYKEVAEYYCFSIFNFDNGYIIHGELEIIKIDINFNIEWSFTGGDIFVLLNGKEAFKILEDTIVAYDWNGNEYIINKFGQQIKHTENNNIINFLRKDFYIETPLFYNNLYNSIRFDLLELNEEEKLSLINNIYNEVFKGSNIINLLACRKRKPFIAKSKYIKLFANLKRKTILKLESKWDSQWIEPFPFQIIFSIKKKSFKHEDYFNDFIHNTEKEYYTFINFDKEIAIEYYENKGIDVVARDKELLKYLYLKYEKYIIGYDKEVIKNNLLFNKMIESDSEKRFKENCWKK